MTVLRRLIMAILLASPGSHGLAGERPDWAFFVPSTDSARPGAVAAPAHWTAPGSTQEYTQAQLRDVLNPPDWYPQEHAAMPDIVAHGSPARDGKPLLLPCALCHLPNGAGHVESASLAGLPEDYIERQFADWRSGSRRIAVGDARSITFLTALKSSYSTTQVQEAARYYSAASPRPWIRVIETGTVRVSAVNPQTLMRLPIAGASEALGRRIVELPENPAGLVYRDAHSGFVAWVPRGSIAAGRALVSDPETPSIPPCTSCHGPRLTGLASAPPLAGRPPTYIVRQLWAFQSGTRVAASAASMRLVAAHLTVDQMLDLAAYLASCPPK